MTQFAPGTEVMVLNHAKSSKWEPHYDGPYTVDKQHRGGNYSLKNAMGVVLDTKYTVEMLKLIDKNDNNTSIQVDKSQVINDKSRDNTDEIDSDTSSYEVQSIVNHRVKAHGYEYFVKWKNFPTSDNSWVKASDFDSLRPINKYWHALKVKAKKSAKELADDNHNIKNNSNFKKNNYKNNNKKLKKIK